MLRMVRVSQPVDSQCLNDPCRILRDQLEKDWLKEKLFMKKRIGLAIGSRGLAILVPLIEIIIERLKKYGKEVSILPAMGSHGGGTAEGQREVLKQLGVDEGKLGVTILSSTQVECLGKTEEGIPFFFSEAALNLDGILLFNRIKPHTSMIGDIQSGLIKMAVIGLGKHKGAQAVHQYGLDRGIPAFWNAMSGKMNIIAGIGMVENGRHQIAEIRVIPFERIFSEEKELLRLASRLFPRLPYEEADLLIIEIIGKEISGTGMDTNVIGKWRRLGGERRPNYRRILVLSLTPKSKGNAVGIGLADFTTEEVVSQMDKKLTYTNAMTANFPEAAKIPIHGRTEYEALHLALEGMDVENAKVLHIKNTMELEQFGVSEKWWDAGPRPNRLKEVRRYLLEADPYQNLRRL